MPMTQRRKKVHELIEKTDPILLHGTPTRNVKRILKEGIKSEADLRNKGQSHVSYIPLKAYLNLEFWGPRKKEFSGIVSAMHVPFVSAWTKTNFPEGQSIIAIDARKIPGKIDKTYTFGSVDEIPKNAIIGSVKVSQWDILKIKKDLFKAGLHPFSGKKRYAYGQRFERRLQSLLVRRLKKLLEEKGCL